ncbi:unannotated protein [freshwater metagenome]|uniref:Unannotated protein n=1 Tax=freshwater metagenome TaxID=449393 RepID=A0A6J7FPK1_9ZZZZ|nr:hypothetical protein [Actinomycetota bacterium]
MWSASRQDGSAVTNFVLVAFPMLAIFVATISITLGSYARLVLLDSTIEGARFAALADQDIASGIAKTRQLVAATLGAGLNVNVAASVLRIGKVESVRFVSTLGIDLIPSSYVLSASSVATRENEY